MILRAKELGLAFWIYDEDGWPSGTAGGRMLADHPEEIQRWLALVPETSDPGAWAIRDESGRLWHLEERAGPGVDYLSPTLGARFLDLAYRCYEEGLAPEAFAYVEAFFDDEPEFGIAHAYDLLPEGGAIPWTPSLPADHLARHGVPFDPAPIFFDLPEAGRARWHFWELLSDLFAERFIRPLDEWCAARGKIFTAHLKGEEHPYFQVPTTGSSERAFQAMTMPGIDALERDTGNDYYPRQASSAARQFSTGRTMAEAFGGAGWGASPADLERYLLWLGGHGVTDFVLHLSQLRLDSAALHDWPPSHPLHMTWADSYGTVLDRVRKALSGRPVADTLVVSPHRAIMAAYRPWELPRTNVHNATTYPDTPAGRINRAFLSLIERLHAAGVTYDAVDERTLEEFGRVEDGTLRVAQAHYASVVLSPSAAIAPATREAITPFLASAQSFAESGGAHNIAGSLGEKAIHPEPDAAGPLVPWRISPPRANDLVLEPEPVGGGAFRAVIRSDLAAPADLLLVFADPLRALSIGGTVTRWTARTPITCGAKEADAPILRGAEGAVARLRLGAGGREAVVRFVPETRIERPFAWVRGSMLVRSDTGYRGAPDATEVLTDGPFIITDVPPVSAEAGSTWQEVDLVAGGYPFTREPITLHTEIQVTGHTKILALSPFHADAVHVRIAGADHGWHWPAVRGQNLAVPAELTPGSYALRLDLVPSSYNVYGPHHYVLGDAPAISPAQVKGERNFIDEALPHLGTHEASWHLKRFSAPSRVEPR
ncbi:hypothetical protein DKM19_21675 [Streptosporangium sp. 'caverna']|nr:hypothetical protein DKM19_21675 [Streptosporangium sp. 'caverna']